MRDPVSSLIISSELKQGLLLGFSSNQTPCSWAAGCSGVDFSLDGAVQL